MWPHRNPRRCSTPSWTQPTSRGKKNTRHTGGPAPLPPSRTNLTKRSILIGPRMAYSSLETACLWLPSWLPGRSRGSWRGRWGRIIPCLSRSFLSAGWLGWVLYHLTLLVIEQCGPSPCIECTLNVISKYIWYTRVRVVLWSDGIGLIRSLSIFS